MGEDGMSSGLGNTNNDGNDISEIGTRLACAQAVRPSVRPTHWRFIQRFRKLTLALRFFWLKNNSKYKRILSRNTRINRVLILFLRQPC
jgi:hypothetical protein